MTNERNAVRWGLVTLCICAGFGFVGLAFPLSAQPWTEVAASTFVGLGTILLLAAAVYFLERGFTKRVSDAVVKQTDASIGERVDEAVQRVEQKVEERFADLRDKYESAARAQDQETSAATERLLEQTTYDSVADALEAANDLRALLQGAVTVPAGEGAAAPHVRVWWGDDSTEHRDWSDAAIQFQMVTGYGQRHSAHSVVDAWWRPSDTAVDVLLELRKQMIRNDEAAAAREFDSEALIRNLSRALSDAVAGVRQEEGAWLTGRLEELVTLDLAVTESGLVARGHGVVVKSSDFPSSRLRPRELPTTGCPVGINQGDWQLAIERAALLHPISDPYRGLRVFDYRAFTPGYSPRQQF